uniref:TMC domain-containing protein n=1 Tax=Setaria digitata TaxID=48799 RepID=A0A915PJ04_9BILA
MHRCCADVVEAARKLYQQILKNFKKNDNENFDSEERVALSQSADRTPESVDDESSSAARLSRRSSVLVDLVSLFRRSSSSTVKAIRLPGQVTEANDGNEEEGDEDPKQMSKGWVLETIRQKKEAIVRLRSQPWSMKRKRRALKVARRYLKRQQSKVSRWHLYKVEAIRRWTIFGRWCSNMKIYLIPWEAKIKTIESHYGSVVSSYFTFLRWVLSVNITMTIIMMLFVTIPEVVKFVHEDYVQWLADSRGGPERFNRTYHIKVMKEKDIPRADELNTVLDFKGYFEYSLLFYGYYSSETYFGDTVQYSVPVAYFTVNLFILGYSFFVILRKMASNARQSKLAGGKAEQYVFNWKLFAGWDYSIGNSETAANVVMANVNKFREIIAEYNVNRSKKFDFLQFTLRVLANILVFTMHAGSVWAILAVSQITTKTSFIQRNAVSITVSFITLTFPNFFDLISKMERYHPRTALRLQLGRVLFLYILNYYTLIISLMFMLNTMESQRNAGEHLVPVVQYSDDPRRVPLYNSSSYQINKQRTSRQVVFDFPSVASSLFNRSKFNDIPTTPLPGKPWTTVFPNFGPFGITNPKAVVTENRRGIMNASTFVAYPIGNTDWTKNISSKPTLLNYSTTVQVVSSAARLSTDWYEECWENLIGEEITKLVTTDLVMTVASILVIDFLRALWVRYTNIWWFWNLETTFPEYGEFKVAENVLHLVNNQGMIWLGLFFVPMLPAINNIKLIILMYVRGWAVMTCNVPARQIFRASRSSNFYLMLLLLMLFLCTLPVGYVIASKKPSKICGPFGSQERFYSIIVQLLDRNLTKGLVDAIRYMISPGIVIPVLLLLLLTIYFLFALVRGLREANTDLTKQLLHERTEEKKRIFELAGGGKKRPSHNASRLFAGKSHESSSPPSKNGNTDDEFSSDRSYKRSNKDLHSYVPSLKSVSEVERSESDEEELEQKQVTCQCQQQQKEEEKLEVFEGKRSWKEKIMTWLGLNEKLDRATKHQSRHRHGDVEGGNDSPISAKKSNTEAGTSDDQRSMTSITESCVYTSPSLHECASALEGNCNSRLSPYKTIGDDESEAESNLSVPFAIEKSVCQLQSQQMGNEKVLHEHEQKHDSETFTTNELFQKTMKEVDSRKYTLNDVSDPRFSYADPYSSYANAMMSPLMEMQILSPAYSEKKMEEEDEFDRVTEKTRLLEEHERRNKHERSSQHEEERCGNLKLHEKQKLKRNEIIQESKPNDTNIFDHRPQAERQSTEEVSRKELKRSNRSSPLNKASPQIKLGRVEARIFLREVKPKLYDLKAGQRSQMVSDSESRMLFTDEDPKLYYTDSECVATSHAKYVQRPKKPIHYAIPYYARMSNAQESVETDALLQQFLMRVNISEDPSRTLPDCSVHQRSPPPLPSASSTVGTETQLPVHKIQPALGQRQLSPSETSRIHCKHTLV